MGRIRFISPQAIEILGFLLGISKSIMSILLILLILSDTKAVNRLNYIFIGMDPIFKEHFFRQDLQDLQDFFYLSIFPDGRWKTQSIFADITLQLSIIETIPNIMWFPKNHFQISHMSLSPQAIVILGFLLEIENKSCQSC